MYTQRHSLVSRLLVTQMYVRTRRRDRDEDRWKAEEKQARFIDYWLRHRRSNLSSHHQHKSHRESIYMFCLRPQCSGNTGCAAVNALLVVARGNLIPDDFAAS